MPYFIVLDPYQLYLQRVWEGGRKKRRNSEILNKLPFLREITKASPWLILISSNEHWNLLFPINFHSLKNQNLPYCLERSKCIFFAASDYQNWELDWILQPNICNNSRQKQSACNSIGTKLNRLSLQIYPFSADCDRMLFLEEDSCLKMFCRTVNVLQDCKYDSKEMMSGMVSCKYPPSLHTYL